MDANDNECHAIYEKWRNYKLDEEGVQEAVEAMRAKYHAAWSAALARLGAQQQDISIQWEQIRTELGR